MEIKRKIYDDLLRWKIESKGRRSVLIEGARRVGKSTIASGFGNNEYRSHIVIDFNRAPRNILNCFENLDDLDRMFQTFALEYGTRLYERDSLIILDEIQKFPRAREAVKYLVEDGRYDYIETGSLISIRENVESITIPSEERKFKMYPLNFEEFAVYLGEELLVEYIRRCYEEMRPLERELHQRAMTLFKEYLLVGGMPQAVLAYKEGRKDFEAADSVKRDIIELYRDDIKKASKRYNSRVSAIFENIPAYLSTHEKKIVLSEIDPNGVFDRYEEPFFWLGDSMICNLCYKCNDPNVGFALHQNDSAVKCYMGDTGLLVSLAFGENELADQQLYRSIMNDRLSINKGMLFENAIAQMVTSSGRKLFFYTRYSEEKHRNDIEIDFLLSNESKTKFRISPVEVKSSKNYSTTSLGRFTDMYGKRIDKSYIVHPKNLVISEGEYRVPPYMFALIL